MTSDDTPDEIDPEVDELIRERVAEHLANRRLVEDLPVTRRDVLAASATLGGGGVALAVLDQAGAVDVAAAQEASGEGTIGTPENPLETVHVAALIQDPSDPVDADTLLIDGNELTIGGARPSSPSEGDVHVEEAPDE